MWADSARSCFSSNTAAELAERLPDDSLIELGAAIREEVRKKCDEDEAKVLELGVGIVAAFDVGPEEAGEGDGVAAGREGEQLTGAGARLELHLHSLALGVPNPADPSVPTGGEDDFELVVEVGDRPDAPPADLDRALAFYTGPLGFEVLSRETQMNAAFLRTAESANHHADRQINGR